MFPAKEAQQISASCFETSAPEEVRGEGNASCTNLEPKIRSSGLICPNLRPIGNWAETSNENTGLRATVLPFQLEFGSYTSLCVVP
jgi:hypothetical protein